MAKSFFSSTVTSLPTKSLKYEKNNFIEKIENQISVIKKNEKSKKRRTGSLPFWIWMRTSGEMETEPRERVVMVVVGNTGSTI